MSDLVCLDGVTKSFKRGSEEIRAVDLIDLTLTDGEYVAIVGPSGSGKTTLLNMIGCIDKPSEGSVEIGGVRTDVLRDSELARVRASTFGFVFQQFFLMPTLTSIENVMVPGRFAVNKQKDLSERARSLLELVGMSDRADHYPTELSGGEMQRVAIARALINKPRVLLADEPTGNLDSNKAQEVTELFDQLNDAGLTVVVVTHNDELARSCTRKIHLKDGKVVDDQVGEKPARQGAAVLPMARQSVVLVEPDELDLTVEATEPHPEQVAESAGYLPSVSAPHRLGVLEMGTAVSVAGIMALISTFLAWVPGASGYAFLTMVNYPGASYGGNIFMRTYTGSGAVLLTGIWPLVIGIVIFVAGIGIVLKRKRAFTVAVVGGAIGLLVAVLDIVMVFAKLRPAAGSGGMAPGAGLWLLAASSLIALGVGIWGAIHSNALFTAPSRFRTRRGSASAEE